MQKSVDLLQLINVCVVRCLGSHSRRRGVRRAPTTPTTQTRAPATASVGAAARRCPPVESTSAHELLFTLLIYFLYYAFLFAIHSALSYFLYKYILFIFLIFTSLKFLIVSKHSSNNVFIMIDLRIIKIFARCAYYTSCSFLLTFQNTILLYRILH